MKAEWASRRSAWKSVCGPDSISCDMSPCIWMAALRTVASQRWLAPAGDASVRCFGESYLLVSGRGRRRERPPFRGRLSPQKTYCPPPPYAALLISLHLGHALHTPTPVCTPGSILLEDRHFLIRQFTSSPCWLRLVESLMLVCNLGYRRWSSRENVAICRDHESVCRSSNSGLNR